MTKEEFITLFASSGYGSKIAAEEYADSTGKEEFTEKDFIELYHATTDMKWNGVKSTRGLRNICTINGKTTAMSNGIAGNSSGSQDWDF